MSSDGVKVKKVLLQTAVEGHQDFALEAFLALIEKDISSNPASITTYSEEEAEDDFAFLKAFRERHS